MRKYLRCFVYIQSMYKKKKNKFIIVFVSPKCAHEKLTNFIVGMNLQYEPKDKEDCINRGKSNPAYLHTPLSLMSADCTFCSSAGSRKIITPQSIHVHPKQSKVMTK